jgi:squalene-associated FAD-dependent desaturase
MVRAGGRRVSLLCPALPAPFHLAAGFLRMRGLGVLHKASAMRAGLLLRGEVDRPDDNETCDMWLRRMGQTQGIRSAFWDPLIWAVLNDDPLVGSAAMLMAVIERAFMGTRDASCLGVPRVPLSRLYVTSALDYLRERGAEILLRSPARRLIVRDDVVRGVELRSGDEVAARQVISAVPPKGCLDILPDRARAHPVFQDVAQLKISPIISLWVFIDRPLFTDVPFLGLMESPIHWLFDRNHIEGRPHTGGVLVGCTISGARSLIDDSQDALMSLFRGEMRRFFPDRPFEVQGFRVLKERRATISHSAGSYQQRPQTKSPVHGLYLAGDWVRTGLPATIESACQSGHDAAAAVLEA